MTTTTQSHPPLRLAVLLSGSGRTLENIVEKIKLGELHASVELVLSSREDAFGMTRAANHRLPAVAVPRKRFKAPAEFSDVAWQHIRRSNADLVVLAGFLSLLIIPDDYAGRVVNIHPALLPSFGGPGMFGHHVHQAVLDAGCKITGCTVHFCDQSYDTGPIILQRACPVLETDTPDTLAARVFEQETIAYPQALELLAQRRVKVVGKRTVIQP